MERQNDHMRPVSRRKKILIMTLLALVVLATTLFYIAITPAHTWIASLFHSQTSVALPANPNSETTMFGYDLRHTRYNTKERQLNIADVSHLQLQWSVSTNYQIISSPVVDNGVLFVGSNNKHFYALDSKSGKALWSYTARADIGSSPAIANGIVYVGSSDDKVYAFNERTGAITWTYTTSNAVWSSPSVANGVVYVGSNDTPLYALDARTGTGL